MILSPFFPEKARKTNTFHLYELFSFCDGFLSSNCLWLGVDIFLRVLEFKITIGLGSSTVLSKLY